MEISKIALMKVSKNKNTFGIYVKIYLILIAECLKPKNVRFDRVSLQVPLLFFFF